MANLSTQTDLTINVLSQEKYDQLKLSGLLEPHQLYFTDNVLLDAEGNRIRNVGSPSLSSDAANKQYVDSAVSSIHVPTDLSTFTNGPGYLLSNDVRISYSDRTIWLSSRANITSVDCNDFIKDGMLSSVELCDTVLVLKFNTDAGSDPVSVDLSNFVDNYDEKIDVLSDAIDRKIFVSDGISGINGYSDLSVVKLSADEYAQMLAGGTCLSNAIYIVEAPNIDAFGQQIKNVASPTDLSDAATKEYVDNALSDIIGEYLPLSGGQLSGDLSVIDAGYVQAPSASISAVKVNSTNNYFIVADEAFSYNDDGTADSCGDSVVGAIGFAVLNAKVSGDGILLKLSGDNVASIVDDFVESQQDANTLWSLALYGYHESNSISVISACAGSYNGWVCCKKNDTLEEIALSCESGVWTESDLANMFLSVNNGFYVPKHPYVGNQKIINFHTQFAAGGSVKAIGKYAHAEGRQNIADGRFSHVEGNNNFAGGTGSHVEGQDSYASASTTHAEGNATSALAFAAHTEGGRTSVTGSYSHAEGFKTQVTKECAHAEGYETSAFGNHSHVEGASTKATARNAHAEGYFTIASGQDSHAQGLSTLASGNQSFAGGSQTSAINLYSFAYGVSALASNENATAFGKSTKASGKYSFTLGNGSEATASYAFAGGNKSKATGDNSFAYGNAVSALAANAYAIGNANCASAYNAVAIGDNNQALGQRSIALGRKSKAINDSQFVWNGTTANYWPNTPIGTFNINPELGLNGFYIGNKNLCSIIDNAISNVQIPTDLSAFTNGPGYLVSNDLSDYCYSKSETSSAIEINVALSSKAEVSAVVPAFFRSVHLVKPMLDGHKLHFKADIASDDQFTDIIVSAFDTASGDRNQYIKSFVVDGLSGKWEQMPAEGLFTDANNTPLMFSLADALSSIDEIPDLSSQYFIRYVWYYVEDNQEVRSDQIAVAVPGNTVAGALPGDVVHKDEFDSVKQRICPSKKIVTLDATYGEFYDIGAQSINELSGEMSGEFKVVLEDYAYGNEYKFQFKTGELSASPTFYIDNGYGPELATSLSVNSDQYEFPPSQMYSVTLQGDVLKVHEFGYTGTAKGGVPSRYALVSKVPEQAGSALSVQIEDRTITTVGISDSTDISVYLPEKPDDGGARDFIVRFEISSSTAPGFTFIGLDESFQFDSDDDDWAVMEPGLNIVSFTETK